jgi:Helix-turn-helix of DDE superfamily endonuclease
MRSARVPRARKRTQQATQIALRFPQRAFGSRQRTKQSGRPSKLSIEDQVLMTLEYWREYRTHFHIGVSWGLDETNVLRNIRKVENILIGSGLFNVEGKKKAKQLDSETEVLVVDVAEHEVERPKKSRKDITVVSKNAIL